MITTHNLALCDIFKLANEAADPVQELKNHYKQAYVKNYVQLAVSDEFTTLDVDTVTFVKYDYHRSMAGALLLNRQTWSIVESILMKQSVSNRTKSIQYKALSEMLEKGDSELLTAILKKNVPDLYPNLTFEVLCQSL